MLLDALLLFSPKNGTTLKKIKYFPFKEEKAHTKKIENEVDVHTLLCMHIYVKHRSTLNRKLTLGEDHWVSTTINK